MKSSDSRKTILGNRPALVMAYKNRALDHFIIECQSFCPLDKIVRIGHVSGGYEEKLKPILLRERVKAAMPRGYSVQRYQKLQSCYERYAFRVPVNN